MKFKSNKIQLIVIPLILISIGIFVIIKPYFTKIELYNNLDTIIQQNTNYKSFLYNIQKERGLSSIYLSNVNKKNYSLLIKQRKETDKHNIPFFEKKLKSIRKIVDKKIIWSERAITLYSKDITNPIIKLLSKSFSSFIFVPKIYKEKEISLTNLKKLELLGIIRATLGCVFSLNEFTEESKYLFFSNYGKYLDLLSNSNINNLKAKTFNKTLDFIEIAKSKNNKFNIKPSVWFDTITSYIDSEYILLDEKNLKILNHIKDYKQIFYFKILSLFFLIFIGSIYYLWITRKLIIQTIESNEKEQLISRNIIYSETNLKGIITYVSDKFIEVSGFKKEELLGKPHNIVRHPDTPKSDFKDMWTTIKNNNKWEGIIKNKKYNDDYYYVKTTVFPIFKNDVKIGYGSSREEITSYEISRRDTELIFNLQKTIIVKRKSDHISYINDNFFLDYPFKDLNDFKKTNYCICDLFESRQHKNYITQIFKGQYWFNYLMDNQNKIHKVCLVDKHGKDNLYTVNYYKNDGNEYVVILTHITELELQNDINQQQTKFVTMGEMIGMIAHQWRQPLSSLNGLFLPIKMKYELGMEVDKLDFFNKIDKQTEIVTFLTNTIEDFLNFMKKDTNYSNLPISELLKKPYRLIENSLNKQNVSFSISYINCDENTTIKTLPNKMDQVLLNFYKNSLDEYVKKNIKDGSIELIVEKKQFNYIIKIKDRAGGIPVEILPKIFDAYFSTKSKNGNGIGLYMTKSIIENSLDGSITVYNENEGCIFELTLPLIN